MEEKVVDFNSYKIEKYFREKGFTIKTDNDKNVKLLIKLKEEEQIK